MQSEKTVLAHDKHVMCNRYSLPQPRAEVYGNQIAVELTRGNWDAARCIVDRARDCAFELATQSKLDWPWEDVGVDPKTANVLVRNGYVCFRDLLGTTPERLGGIVQLGKKFAAKLHAKAQQLQTEQERDAANDRFYLSPDEMLEACRR